MLEEVRIDVIICDLAMPEMDGWEVAKAAADLCEARCVPKPLFILITGWGGQILNWTERHGCGVDLVLEKPIHIPKLIDAITQALEHAPQ